MVRSCIPRRWFADSLSPLRVTTITGHALFLRLTCVCVAPRPATADTTTTTPAPALGEDYSLPTALRQGVLQPMVSWVFYLPLALVGLHPNSFRMHYQLNTLYQFWIHTDMVGRLPFGLEYVLNTPSHHRMHHRPPGNCNYAGVLIIWDRIFGTFVPETNRKDYYGLAKQPNTFDMLRLNINHLQRMSDIDGQGGGGLMGGKWIRHILRRRVPARWSLDLRGLFRPIPALAIDKRASKVPKMGRCWCLVFISEFQSPRLASVAVYLWACTPLSHQTANLSPHSVPLPHGSSRVSPGPSACEVER